MRIFLFKLIARRFKAVVVAQLLDMDAQQIVDMSKYKTHGIVGVYLKSAFNSPVVIYGKCKCWMHKGLIYWEEIK